jgi:membrane associated rhomboid family serine protease
MDLVKLLHDAPVACVIFALTLAISFIAFSSDWVYENFILHPASVYHGKNLHTLITSGFIHADLMHLFFNMFSFFFFAFTLEGKLGHWQFGLLYGLSLVLSDLPTVVRYKDSYNYRSLGASGAISAVIFSFILFNPLAGMGFVFLPGIDIPAVIFGALYLYYCSYASKRQLGNINHDAHLFGALSGIMITIVMRPHVLVDFIHAISEKVQSLLH